jgi:hypothetical protein
MEVDVDDRELKIGEVDVDSSLRRWTRLTRLVCLAC